MYNLEKLTKNKTKMHNIENKMMSYTDPTKKLVLKPRRSPRV